MMAYTSTNANSSAYSNAYSNAYSKIKIVEVGLRDGLQNEKKILTEKQKVDLALRLLDAGVKNIEVGAFVRYDLIPQMKGSQNVVKKLNAIYGMKNDSPRFTTLVPNEQGMENALKAGVKEVAVFASCSETFSQKNINCTIDESFRRFESVFKLARKNKIKVRGYLSVCFGCPFEGAIKEEKVIELTQKLIDMGAYEISLGDTIGIAHIGQVRSLLTKLAKKVSLKKVAGHFHDTRGQALANILESYHMGVRVFDSSVGGLGGCPYAPRSTGNVATEDVLFMFHNYGVRTGIDLNKYLKILPWLEKQMGKELPSRLHKVGLAKLNFY